MRNQITIMWPCVWHLWCQEARIAHTHNHTLNLSSVIQHVSSWFMLFKSFQHLLQEFSPERHTHVACRWQFWGGKAGCRMRPPVRQGRALWIRSWTWWCDVGDWGTMSSLHCQFHLSYYIILFDFMIYFQIIRLLEYYVRQILSYIILHIPSIIYHTAYPIYHIWPYIIIYHIYHHISSAIIIYHIIIYRHVSSYIIIYRHVSSYIIIYIFHHISYIIYHISFVILLAEYLIALHYIVHQGYMINYIAAALWVQHDHYGTSFFDFYTFISCHIFWTWLMPRCYDDRCYLYELWRTVIGIVNDSDRHHGCDQ